MVFHAVAAVTDRGLLRRIQPPTRRAPHDDRVRDRPTSHQNEPPERISDEGEGPTCLTLAAKAKTQ
jgi:hypothetical protein